MGVSIFSVELVKFAEVGVNSELTLSKAIHVWSKHFGEVGEICDMLFVDEWLASLVSLTALFHCIADLFVLPDALCSIIKNGAFDYVAA